MCTCSFISWTCERLSSLRLMAEGDQGRMRARRAQGVVELGSGEGPHVSSPLGRLRCLCLARAHWSFARAGQSSAKVKSRRAGMHS